MATAAALAILLLASLPVPGAHAMDRSGDVDYEAQPDDGNEAPYNPPAPWGPSPVAVNDLREYCTRTTDPDGDAIQYVFDWADGSPHVATRSYPNGQTGCDVHRWSTPGTYCIRAYAQDLISPVRPDWRDGACHEVLVREKSANQAPGIPPPPTGPSFRSFDQSGTYCTKTTDPDGDPFQYVFLWGDGDQTVVQSTGNQEGCAANSWSAAGRYEVKVYAQDLITPVRGTSNPKEVDVGSGSSSNSPPSVPAPPKGPAGLQVRQSGTFCAESTDPDGDSIEYVFSWGDNTPDTVTQKVASGKPACAAHAWSTASKYCVKAYAQDLITPVAARSTCKDVSVVTASSGNTAPYVPPPPQGPSRLALNEWGSFCTSSSDPDDDYFQYVFFWGDGAHTMSESGCAAHAWSTSGSYCIQAYTQDLKNEVRGWSKPCTTVEVGSGHTNVAPDIPEPPYTPDGVYTHTAGTAVTYCARSDDRDGDAIEYVFYWDALNDPNSRTASSRVASGSVGCATHAWPVAASYCVKVYAQDRINEVPGASSCRTQTVTSATATPSDSDGDGLNNGDEAARGTDATKPDSDGDGLKDGDEVHLYRTSPTSRDTDGDGLEDKDEVTGTLNAAHSATHQARGAYSFGADRCASENPNRCSNPGATDPGIADSDGDGLSDGNEVLGVYKTSQCASGPYCDRWFLNPNQADTDGDSPAGSTNFLDNTERLRSTPYWQSANQPYDPSHFDPDGDFLPDAREFQLTTDPFNWDTDHDLVGDGAEALEGGFGSDPRKGNTDKDSLPDLHDPDPYVDNDPPFLLGWKTLENDAHKGLCISVADQTDVIASKVARKIVTEVWRDGGVGPTLHRREEAWDNSTVVMRWDDTKTPPMMCLDYRLPTSFFGSDQYISRVEVTLQDAGGNALRLGFDLTQWALEVAGWQLLEQAVCWVPFVGSGLDIAKAVYKEDPLSGASGGIELAADVRESAHAHGRPLPVWIKVMKVVGSALCLIDHAMFLNESTQQSTSMQVETNPQHADTFLLQGGQRGKASIKVVGYEAQASLAAGGKSTTVWRGDGYNYLMAKHADRGWSQSQWHDKLQRAFTYGSFGSECAGTSLCYTVVEYPQDGVAWKVYIHKGVIVDVHLSS